MPSSRLSKEELKEDTNNVLHTLWNAHPSSSFHDAFERAVKSNLVDSVVIVAMMFYTNERKESFSASENVRKMNTLDTYYCHLQMKCEDSFLFSGITKEDYENFKSQLNSDSPSLASIHEESDFSLNSVHMDSFS